MRPTFLELAENANTYTPLRPGSERVVEPGYVIWFGEDDHPSATVVQRLRLDAGRLEDQIALIQGEVAARGRRSCTWEIAGSTPLTSASGSSSAGSSSTTTPTRSGWR